MWLLERCRINWEDTSYPDLIAEAEASEPFRNLICPDDKVFDNPANMEETIKNIAKTIINQLLRHADNWFAVYSKVLHYVTGKYWKICNDSLLIR